MNCPPCPVPALLAGFSLLLLSAAAPAAGPEQVELLCTEQNYHEVVFGEGGQVSYQEHPPKRTTAVAIAIEQPPGADQAVIRSEDPALATNGATWLTATRLEANNGRLQLDLTDQLMTLTEADSAQQARFRRFQCQPVPAAAP